LPATPVGKIGCASGGLGFIGLSATQSESAATTARDGSNAAGSTLPQFGRAKNVILLYLFGGPSHLEMCDMKPDAPVEVRGQFAPISSALPGCQVCEHLLRLARVMDRVTVVRLLTHPWTTT